MIPGGEWTTRIIHLLNDQHMGVVTAAVSLIDALVKKNPDEYKGCVALAVSRLSRVSKDGFNTAKMQISRSKNLMPTYLTYAVLELQIKQTRM